MFPAVHHHQEFRAWSDCRKAVGRQRGYGLLEIALALGLAALLVAGAMAYFAHANAELRKKEAIEFVTATQAIVESLYSGQPSYAGLTTRQLAGNRQMPRKFVRGLQLVSPMGAGADVFSRAGGLGYFIRLNRVSDEDCIFLATSVFSPGITALVIEQKSWSRNRPFTIARARSFCTGGRTGNDFRFQFGVNSD